MEKAPLKFVFEVSELRYTPLILLEILHQLVIYPNYCI